MGKCMVAAARVLLVCALVLVLPSVAAAQSTQPSPGWYTNNGRAPIPGNDEWRIMWADSYIYQHPGTDNLYWYAHITYFNKSNKTLTLNCLGEDQLPPVREHITRGGTYLGYVDAEETFCDGNQSWVGSFKPGETFDDWVIFHNVPWLGDQVRLQWDPYGFSEWVNPWQSPFSAPPPAGCPDELVALGTCYPVLRAPDGMASNLIVLVHGCCTNANGVKEWDELGRLIAGKIQAPGTWEILVWDWSDYTPPLTDINIGDWLKPFRDAYENILKHPDELYRRLANAIANHHYKHVHLIGHSAGAKFIQLTAEELVLIYKHNNENPSIHITFLDAYTRENSDTLTYGFLPNYPNHYSDHYVDIGLPSTDACLASAFNFNVSNWLHFPSEGFPLGHWWPVNWYKKSVTSTSPKFKYGFTLSLEGGGKTINELVNEMSKYPAGQQCPLSTILFNDNPDCQRAACWSNQ